MGRRGVRSRAGRARHRQGPVGRHLPDRRDRDQRSSSPAGCTSTAGATCRPSAAPRSVAGSRSPCSRSRRVREVVGARAAPDRPPHRRSSPRIQRDQPFSLEVRQSGLLIGLRVDHPDGAVYMQQELFERGVWAIASGFDQSVLQFKPGLLLDDADVDVVLERLGDALARAKDVDRPVPRRRRQHNDSDQPSTDKPPGSAARAPRSSATTSARARLDFVRHSENTTFRSTTRAPFALRLDRPGYQTSAAVRSEIAGWTPSRATGSRTPEPVPAPRPRVVQQVQLAGSARRLVAVQWVDGVPAAGRRPAPVGAAGRDHGVHPRARRGWTPPPRLRAAAWDARRWSGEHRAGEPVPRPLVARRSEALRLRATTSPRLAALPDDRRPLRPRPRRPRLRERPRRRDGGRRDRLRRLRPGLVPLRARSVLFPLVTTSGSTRRDALVAGYRKVGRASGRELAELPTFLMAGGSRRSAGRSPAQTPTTRDGSETRPAARARSRRALPRLARGGGDGGAR